MQIILASASGRRKDLLVQMGLKFEAKSSAVDEQAITRQQHRPSQLVKALALAKAVEVNKIMAKSCQLKAKSYLIIAADTIIVFGGRIIGKPKDRREAISILQQLSGRQHSVITGIALLDDQNRKKIATDRTAVIFRKLTDRQINDYLDTGLYLDRAGAYGIQDPRCDFVKSYRGSYTNILGLPMKKLARLLLTYGIDLKNNSQGGSDGRR